MTFRTTILLLAGLLACLCCRFAWRARVGWKRRQNWLKMDLRLEEALEVVHQELLRLKHRQVVRPSSSGLKAGLIPSTNVRSLRYIKGRKNED